MQDVSTLCLEDRITWQSRLNKLIDEYQSMDDNFFSQGYQTLTLLKTYFVPQA